MIGVIFMETKKKIRLLTKVKWVKSSQSSLDVVGSRQKGVWCGVLTIAGTPRKWEESKDKDSEIV